MIPLARQHAVWRIQPMATQRGILLVNLGSPDSPSVPDVRRYLNQFLMDPRVIDSPWLVRRFVVSAFILPTRPKKVAEAYRSVWTPEGSPLVVISKQVERLLRDKLDVPVSLGMTYGNPSIESALRDLLSRGVSEVFLVPMFPHYAMATFEAVVVAVEDTMKRLSPSTPLDHDRLLVPAVPRSWSGASLE